MHTQAIPTPHAKRQHDRHAFTASVLYVGDPTWRELARYSQPLVRPACFAVHECAHQTNRASMLAHAHPLSVGWSVGRRCVGFGGG
eukprot:5787073-Prymnesium_polylepis.1